MVLKHTVALFYITFQCENWDKNAISECGGDMSPPSPVKVAPLIKSMANQHSESLSIPIYSEWVHLNHHADFCEFLSLLLS